MWTTTHMKTQVTVCAYTVTFTSPHKYKHTTVGDKTVFTLTVLLAGCTHNFQFGIKREPIDS